MVKMDSQNLDKSLLKWSWQRLDDMQVLQLYRLLALREAIFVVEQECAYQELDGLDEAAWHLTAWLDDQPVACLRLLPPGVEGQDARIGRVAVAMGWRKAKLGQELMSRGISKVLDDYPSATLSLSAQTYLRRFYESLGFGVTGEGYLEDGIPHLPMAYQGK